MKQHWTKPAKCVGCGEWFNTKKGSNAMRYNFTRAETETHITETCKCGHVYTYDIQAIQWTWKE